MPGATEPDPPTKPALSKGAAATHSSGGKIPYPKHVWSPAGGWYGQPHNWKSNTAVMAAVVFGITALAFKWSADHEFRWYMPEKGRFFPSRYWSKQIKEYEQAEAAKESHSESR